MKLHVQQLNATYFQNILSTFVIYGTLYSWLFNSTAKDFCFRTHVVFSFYFLDFLSFSYYRHCFILLNILLSFNIPPPRYNSALMDLYIRNRMLRKCCSVCKTTLKMTNHDQITTNLFELNLFSQCMTQLASCPYLFFYVWLPVFLNYDIVSLSFGLILS